MSVIGKESIKVAGELAGISGLSDEIASSLAPDVEYRIREVIEEALKFMRHSKREKMTTEDINRALHLRNVEMLYGYASKEPLTFQRVPGSKDLFYIEDREVEFSDIINSALPKCPRDSSLASHWLAIEGVQPQIPQNPPPVQAETQASPTKKKKPSGTSRVRPLVKHVLSKELQLYYEKVALIMRGNDNAQIDDAIESLSNDPGLNPLLPYFIQFVSDEVTHNLTNLALLFHLMRMLMALLRSSYFNVEPYLHQMMPPILTCLVGRQLCENPTTQDHWGLRDYSAKLLSTICKTYGNSYASLQPRTQKTLLKALLDLSKPLATHYGAIVGITALGPQTVEAILLPNTKLYLQWLRDGESDANREAEAKRCEGALLKAAVAYLLNEAPSAEPKAKKFYGELAELFGSKLAEQLKLQGPQ
eukprot:TRINITY_DN14252_c0_g1_i1.p1 TRINITY_DN14252_c0_g1~~TRINITY_DN14252_c0_g1_i1.p1  ORF type:complete len:419 (+),score=46.85 TRINITY_DN14252_c0_g1_i1:78-1334(+)